MDERDKELQELRRENKQLEALAASLDKSLRKFRSRYHTGDEEPEQETGYFVIWQAFVRGTSESFTGPHYALLEWQNGAVGWCLNDIMLNYTRRGCEVRILYWRPVMEPEHLVAILEGSR